MGDELRMRDEQLDTLEGLVSSKISALQDLRQRVRAIGFYLVCSSFHFELDCIDPEQTFNFEKASCIQRKTDSPHTQRSIQMFLYLLARSPVTLLHLIRFGSTILQGRGSAGASRVPLLCPRHAYWSGRRHNTRHKYF